ncbi:MAG: hypothetical protein LH618_16700 [Saprospiraceae bacterium]|nr:hypothetical protein [Saprospiraceae bacterium]
MKNKNKSLLWMLLACFTLALSAPAQAQDDLYYDPATVKQVSPNNNNNNNNNGDNNYDEGSNVTRRYSNDDDAYHDDDDYAYEYSSRIRRFHRPSPVVDYYDPYHVDLYNYDPYFLPGNSIYTHGYNDYWTWRRWQRWNRWNRWNSFNPGWGGNAFSPWGWNSGFGGFNAWNSPSVFNNYYYDPYWTWNGCNPYYNNGWANNNYFNNNSHYNNNNNNNNGGENGDYRPQTYTGVRRNGSSVNPGYTRISENGNGRLTTSNKNSPVIEMKSRPNGRTMTGKEPTQAERAKPTTNRRPTNTPNGEVRGRNTTPTERPGRTSPTQTERPRTTPRSETTPSRRPPTEETTPRQREETRPSRRQEQTNERRTRTEQPQPTRRQTETRSEERPNRSETRSAPQRSETPRTESRDNSTRSGGDNNSGSSSGRRGRRGQ